MLLDYYSKNVQTKSSTKHPLLLSCDNLLGKISNN